MATPGPEHSESFEQPNSSVLCSNNCGFFANPACNNLCSKCYRDAQSEQERNMANESAAAAAMAKANAVSAPPQVPSQPSPPAPEPSTSRPSPLPSPPQANSPLTVPETSVAEGAVAAMAQAAVAVPREAPMPEQQAEQASVSAAAGDAPDERPVQKNTSRCFSCKKKIGLTGFKCRCGYVFCSTHRYAEAHDCSFDYKAMGRENLARNNPLVQANKVTKI